MGNVTKKPMPEKKLHRLTEHERFHVRRGYSLSLKSKHMTDQETLSSSCLFSSTGGDNVSLESTPPMSNEWAMSNERPLPPFGGRNLGLNEHPHSEAAFAVC